MKVVVPWPVDAAELAPMPDGVELVAWIDGDPPAEALEAEFVAVPYSAGKPGLLDGFSRMKVLQTESAGVGWILPHVPAGVTVCDASGPHDQSTAEWVLAAILTSTRQMPWYTRQQDASSWSPSTAHELGGRRVLIVGAGSIGRAVERMLSGFGVDITRVARTARDGVHGFDELASLLPDADVVVLLVPLTDLTAGMVDAAFLAALPNGALVVNASRGAVIDQDALLAELTSERITAVLDVTSPEPLPLEHPLWRAPGVLITPHVGGDTYEVHPRLRTFVRDQVTRYVSGKPLLNVVENGY
jgi:phosphoglycerate dehydrogenase-like enzyme